MIERLGIDFRKVSIVFGRELRDQLRDRRTLFMVIVLPVLLYPALGIGMLQMAVVFSERPRTVVVLGAGSLPEPRLIEGGSFAARWFADPFDATRLSVETDNQPGLSPAAVARLELASGRIRDLFEQRRRMFGTGSPEDVEASSYSPLDIESLDDQISRLLRGAEIDVLVIIPDDFAENLREIDQLIAERQPLPEDPGEYARPAILVSGDEKSLIASRRVERVFEAWEEQLLALRLAAAGLPKSLPSPVDATVVRVAGVGQESALIWSKLYPVILVLMTVTGAFYPAIDLAAGEKERGTMETLLITPARRVELVLAKFLTILVFSLTTAVLNLVALGVTAGYMLGLAGSTSAEASFAPPPTSGLGWVLVMLIPLAALFSALCLALATFAKSTREGQYYLTPLMIMVTIMVAMAASPGVELQPFHVVLPVIGPALLLKELLIDPTRTETLVYLVPVLLASFSYAALALWWAVAQFHSEEVLFREAERFDLRLWLKRLWQNKPAVPGAGGAVCCLALALIGQLVLMRPVGEWLGGITLEEDRYRAAILTLMGQQLLLFLLPALLLGVFLLSDVRRTFRIRGCRFQAVLLAIGLAIVLHPPVLELIARLEWFFPQGLPAGSQEFVREMLGPRQSVWLILLAIAIVPAHCEEILFRGYILSALDRPGRRGLAVVLSSLAFGAMHMIPQQVFYATLLGLVLGLLVIRTGSLLPGIVFHATFNALGVLGERLKLPAELSPTTEFLFSIETTAGHSTLRYDWPLLLLTTVAAAVLLRLAWSLTPLRTDDSEPPAGAGRGGETSPAAGSPA